MRQGDPLHNYFEKQRQENVADLITLYTPPSRTGSARALRGDLPPRAFPIRKVFRVP